MHGEIDPGGDVVPLLINPHHDQDSDKGNAFVRINKKFLFHKPSPGENQNTCYWPDKPNSGQCPLILADC